MTKSFSHALSIIKKIHENGYVAYFAGGWVRDYLLRHQSDDIDIATNASPEVLQSIFPHTVPIGIAFGIILIVVEDHSFEVATFRKEAAYKDGRRPTEITYTTAREDALRRDFTINGMFYDPLKKEVLDYVEGKKDLEHKIIRAIGNAHERIQEDRLRMIRAIRFACRFGFTIEPSTREAILAHNKELFPAVAIERVWQELTKMAAYQSFADALLLLYEYGLLQTIFSALEEKSFSNIHRKTEIIKAFPLNAPAIAKVLELFSSLTLEEKLSICLHFKLSKEESNFVIFYDSAEKLFSQKQIEEHALAHFFANSWSEVTLKLIAEKLPLNQKDPFLQALDKKRLALLDPIERIKKKIPLVTSLHLKKEGIVPGKTMGELLKLAEKIAINEHLDDANAVVEKLKKSILWPTE